jgi:1-acyl-sn-glycerol-3-phosphate acyltransferase
VSFVDALVILAASPRPIRFVMDHNIFKVPVLSFVFRTGKAIPIASAKENEALLNAAYDEIARALAQGDLVGIFPEGRITDTGRLYPFKGGITPDRRAHAGAGGAARAEGLWGSFFSRKAARR